MRVLAGNRKGEKDITAINQAEEESPVQGRVQKEIPRCARNDDGLRKLTKFPEALRVVNLGVHPSPPSFFLHLQKLGSLFFKLLLHLGQSFLLQSLAPAENFAA